MHMWLQLNSNLSKTIHAGTHIADMVFRFARQDKSLPMNTYTGDTGYAYVDGS